MHSSIANAVTDEATTTPTVRQIPASPVIPLANAVNRGRTPAKPYLANVPGQRGDWFKVSKDRLRFGPTLKGDAAWKVVSADRLVEKPKPGWSIVLGTVTYKPTKGGIDHLWGNINVRFRGGDGKLYTGYDELKNGGLCPYSLDLSDKTGAPDTDFTIPNDGKDPQFFPCAVVPTKALKGGVWQVDTYDIAFKPQVQYVQAIATPKPAFPKGLTPLNPYAAKTSTSSGDWFEIPFFAGDYGVLFGPTIAGEEAWNLVDSPNNPVKHPAPGWSIVLVNAVLENRTDQDAAPFQNIMGPDFVGNDGVVYSGSNSLSPGGSCPWIPTSLFQRGLDARESFIFTGCAVVPDAAIPGGVWQIGPFDPFVIPQHVYVQAALNE